MTYDVFISYARIDGLEFAERLERDLSAHGYSIWRDKRNLDVYQDFTAEIEIGIRESRFVVVCVSPSIEQNPYSFVRREISYARSKNKPIIPLVLPNADVPLDIINLTWIGCFDGPKPTQTLAYDQGFTNLLTRLTRNDEPGSRPVASSDPYREYVEGLYEGIVNLLDQTMIKLIEVHSEATPAAVQGAPKKHNPLAAFKGRYGMKADTVEAPITSFRDAYERYQGRVLLLGEPGAGKSTTLLSFARDTAAARLSDPTQPLPLLARCAMWDSTAQTPIIEWVAQSADIPVSDLTPLIQSGKTILLLDALDELGHERVERKKGSDGKDIEERYDPRKRFVPLLPISIPLVLSCRIKDYAELGEMLPLNGAVTLQPFTDDQIQHYLSDVTGLWEVVQSDPALLDIARTPLLLSIIAFAFRDAPEELKPRANLSEVGLRNYIFDRYVRERYAYEQNRNDDPLPFTLEEVQQVLGHVAMINASGGRRDYQPTPEIVENVLEWQDFAEKLPADKIDTFLNFATLLDLLIHLEGERTSFIHLKLRDAFAYDYCLPRLYEEELCRGWYWHPSPAKALGQVADREAILKLITLLKDKEAKTIIRACAAQGLGKTQSTIPLDALIETLHDKSVEEDVRSSTSGALGNIGGLRATDALIAVLKDKSEEISFIGGVRSWVAEALGKIGGERALNALVDVLQDKSDDSDTWGARSAAADALGRIGGERALIALVDVLQDKSDEDDIRAAIPDAMSHIQNELAFEVLLNIFRDKTDVERMRSFVPRALSSINDERAFPILINVLVDRTETARVRAFVCRTLSKNGEEQAWSLLLDVFLDKTDDNEVRAAAAESLGRRDIERAFPILLDVLMDKTNKHPVRSSAVETLAFRSSKQALHILFPIFKNIAQDQSDDKDVRSSVLQSLIHFDNGELELLNILVKVLADTSDEVRVRCSAIFSLNHIRNETAIQALINALSDVTRIPSFQDEMKRICDIAADTLKLIGTSEAIAAVTAWESAQSSKDANYGKDI